MTQEASGTPLAVPVSQRDHSLGPAAAPVTLVEYADFQCPFCGLAYPAIKKLRQQLADRLRFVFRHFPRPEHAYARHAAQAAEAAAAQDKFWEMHDALYEHQSALEDKDLVSYVAECSLDTDRFRRDLVSHASRDRVQEDVLSAIAGGAHGTPTFFINGIRHDGAWEFEDLLAAVTLAERATGR